MVADTNRMESGARLSVIGLVRVTSPIINGLRV